MEQIIEPENAVYRTISIMDHPSQGVPNYLLYLKMNDCDICTRMEPIAHFMAREFHKDDSPLNTIVATVNCSEESALFMCEFLNV